MTSSDTALRAVSREYVPAGRDEIQLETSSYPSGLYFVPLLVGPLNTDPSTVSRPIERPVFYLVGPDGWT